MAMDHLPIQNSEVYLLTSSHPPTIPPPSPPSPACPVLTCERELSPPLDDLLSITPPQQQEDPASPTLPSRLASAVHVLGTQATALSCLARLYETNPTAQDGFDAAVANITRHRGDRGKLVICGVGKSGHIAKKLVATMNSLQIHATYLHPTEALHGDLGKIGRHDSLLLITFSGKTPELLSLLPHFDPSLPLIVLTSHTTRSACEIIRRRPDAILLPAPIHVTETDSFGFSAPTTSTTMAIALGDALAIVVSGELHSSVSDVFLKNHPGGAIGDTASSSSSSPSLAIPSSPSPTVKTLEKITDVMTHFSTIPELITSSSSSSSPTGFDVLKSTSSSSSSSSHHQNWIRLGSDYLASPRRIARLSPADMHTSVTSIPGLMVHLRSCVVVSGGMDVDAVRRLLESLRGGMNNVGGGSDMEKYGDDGILVVVVEGSDDGSAGDGGKGQDTVAGVLEIGDLMA